MTIHTRRFCSVLCLVLLFLTTRLVAQDGSFWRDGVQLFYRTSRSGTPVERAKGLAFASQLPEGTVKVQVKWRRVFGARYAGSNPNFVLVAATA